MDQSEKSFDELFGPAILKQKNETLKNIVLTASHLHTVAELIRKNPLLDLSIESKLGALAGQSLPKMIYTSGGLTILGFGQPIHIQAIAEPFSFLVDGKKFTVNPAWSFDELTEQVLAQGIVKSQKKNQALFRLLLPEARAIVWETAALLALVVAFVMYEATSWLPGFIAGCLGSMASAKGIAKTKACYTGGKDGAVLAEAAPFLLLPDGLGPVFDEYQKMKSIIGRAVICGKDGSFTIGNEKDNRPSMFYYDGTKREITFPRGSKFPPGTIKLDEIEPMLKKLAAGSHVPGINKKIEQSAAAAKKDVVQMETNCLENPMTTFRLTPSGLEKARSEIERTSTSRKAL